MLGKSQLTDGLPVPIPCGGVIKLRGCGNGVLRTLGTGQEIAQQVRGQQQRVRNLQGRVLLPHPAVELVEGVEGQIGVDAGAAVKHVGRNLLLDRIDIRLHTQTVGTGHAGQVAVLIQQAVIHAPGIDTKGIQIAVAALLELHKSLLELVVQVGGVPVEDTVHFHIVVFKAVQFGHGDFFTIKLAQDRAAIAGTQVKCQKISHFCHNLPPDFHSSMLCTKMHTIQP